MALTIRWSDASGFLRLQAAMKVLSSAEVDRIASRALNRTGDMARTQVTRALAKQTGLKRGLVVKAIRTTRAKPGGLTYQMKASGGDVALKYFAPRETKPGVSAAPFGKRQVFPGSFMKAGWVWGKRITKPEWQGNVFHRTGLTTKDGNAEFRRTQSGVVIPNEMVKGATKDAFETSVAVNLPRRLAHEIARSTKGAVT